MKRIGGLSVLILVSWQASAFAHIHLVTPIGHTDLLTGDQKNEHCGDIVAYDRAAHPERVTTYAPGATIEVKWLETIDHPGHFRIAFQPNGTVFRIPQNVGGGGFPTLDETGMTDDKAVGTAGALPGSAVTNSMILLDQIADGTLSKMITLPNIECDNCTLQFIQVMTDKPPYTIDVNSDDIYFNCADIVLKAGTPPPSATPDAGVPATGDAGTENDPNGPSATTGGCSTTSTSSSALFGIALLVGLRRRRR